MLKLYDDLEKIYEKVCRDLTLLSQSSINGVEREKLIAWIKEELLEIKIYLQALAENKIYEGVSTQSR